MRPKWRQADIRAFEMTMENIELANTFINLVTGDNGASARIVSAFGPEGPIPPFNLMDSSHPCFSSLRDNTPAAIHGFLSFQGGTPLGIACSFAKESGSFGYCGFNLVHQWRSGSMLNGPQMDIPLAVRNLVALGADPNNGNPGPLFHALSQGLPATVRTLCACGADPLARWKGDTVLHVAIRGLEGFHRNDKGAQALMIKTLIGCGADPLVRDDRGMTAMDIAFDLHSRNGSSNEEALHILESAEESLRLEMAIRAAGDWNSGNYFSV